MTELVPTRQEYRVDVLEEHELDRDPMVTVRRWIDDAVAADLPEPTAVTLATADAEGRPDARIVLLRGLDERGVWWFTNRHSAKGEQLAARPSAAIVAHWQPLERQIRLRGDVSLLSDEESDAYFATRPRGSQLAAWASAQSSPVADRRALEVRMADVEERFDGQPVPRPAHWGGYLLRPMRVELWQGRPARLHDRIRYDRNVDGWQWRRLQP